MPPFIVPLTLGLCFSAARAYSRSFSRNSTDQAPFPIRQPGRLQQIVRLPVATDLLGGRRLAAIAVRIHCVVNLDLGEVELLSKIGELLPGEIRIRFASANGDDEPRGG